MQNLSFDKNPVNGKQQVHWQQDWLKSFVSELGQSRQFMKAVTNHRNAKVWRKIIFHKENDGNFYNFVGNTISLKEHGPFILWEKTSLL